LQDVDYPGLPNPAPTARVAVRLSETPGEIVTRPPTLGEHTDLVLGAIGYDADAIAQLRRKGIV
jgi:crotonobetainyl-CoA:carnitine CoA-transferase CaiB-like acyl-CoA transferase